MSLFQCENCGCVENTALSSQGCRGYFGMYFDWSYAPEREGLLLCSECAPVSYRSGKPTKFGRWHGQFPQTFLPIGEWETNEVGNLRHKATGETDYRKHAIEKPRP